MFRRLRDFPRELWIGENLWRIKFVRRMPDGDPDDRGCCDPSEHVIYIKLGQAYEERMSTFFHEVLHALEYEGGFDVVHAHVEKLGEGLAQLFVKNVV